MGVVGAGVVIYVERGVDLHMAQLMPLPLSVSCFSKIQTGYTFLVPAHPEVPDKGPLNVCVCVCCIVVAVVICRHPTTSGLQQAKQLALNLINTVCACTQSVVGGF